jgi:hypothetical protein
VSDVLWQRLDQIARNVSPFAITVLLLIIGLVPLRLPYLPPLSVSLVLVSVYYWAVHRPSALPAPAVFFLGLMADLLGAVLGVNAPVLLVALPARWRCGLASGPPCHRGGDLPSCPPARSCLSG